MLFACISENIGWEIGTFNALAMRRTRTSNGRSSGLPRRTVNGAPAVCGAVPVPAVPLFTGSGLDGVEGWLGAGACCFSPSKMAVQERVSSAQMGIRYFIRDLVRDRSLASGVSQARQRLSLPR